MRQNYAFILLAALSLFSYASSSAFFQKDNMRVLENVEVASDEPLCDGVTIQVTSQDDRETSIGIRNHLARLKPESKLLEFILGPKPKDDLLSEYVGPLVGKSAQWIVFFAIGLITLIGCSVSFIWTWRAAKKRLAKGQTVQVGKGTQVFLVVSLVLLTFLLGADIATLVFSAGQVTTSKGQVVCGVATFGDYIESGKMDEHWVGAVTLRDKTLLAIAGIGPQVQRLSYNTGPTDGGSVTAAFTTVSASVSTFYDDNQGKTLQRADPTMTTAYTPTFIENLGPSSKLTSESGKILQEMQSKKDRVVGAATNITTAIATLKYLTQNPSVSGPKLAHSIQVAKEAAQSVIDTTAELKGYASDFGDIVGALQTAVIVITSVDLAFVVIALAAIGLFYRGYQRARKAIHLSWCMIGLLMVLTWVLATISWAASFAVNDVCRVAEGLLADEVIYNATANKFFNEDKNFYAKGLLYTCLHGEGDILKALGGRETLGPFESMFLGLDNTADLTESLQTVPDSIILPQKRTELTQISNGLASDSPLTNTDLAKLNTFTNRGTNTCTQARDTWALNSANCQSSAGTVFAATSPAGFNLGYTTCIGLDNWGNKDVDDRYNPTSFPQPSCGQFAGSSADVGLVNYVYSFITHKENVNDLFGDVLTSLGNVETANTNYMTAVKAATANIFPVRAQTADMYALLGSSETGILKNSYCSFLKDTFQVVEDQACVRLLPGVYRQAITLIVAGFLGLFILPLLFLYSKRLLQMKNKEIYSSVSSKENNSPTIVSPVTSP